MTKEDELMEFLYEKVFDPVLASNKASKKIKAGVNLTINRMKKRDAHGMIQFFWSSIVGTDRSIDFSKQMKKEGFNRFEDIIEDFRLKFNDNWLRK